jgi:hypothetical protein
VRAAIEARGAELRFLPPCSPDMNPIEQVFAKLKNPVRAAAPREVEALWKTIGDSLGRFASPECANYLANSDYPRIELPRFLWTPICPRRDRNDDVQHEADRSSFGR